MKRNVYSIFDDKAGFYAAPFYFGSDGEALRAFSDACGDEKSLVNKHPADFRLYRLGEFDDNSGSLKGLGEPKFIAVASDFVAKV